jgi:protein SCO1/2
MTKFVLGIVTLIIIAFAYVYKMNYSPKEQNFSTPHLETKVMKLGVEYDGKVLEFEDFLGKTVIVYFGFASCPDVCPMSLSYLNGALKDFDPSQYKVIFISVDYKRDRPESVAKYTKYFNKNYIGVVGDKDFTERITKDFAAYYKFIDMPNSELGYTVDHTSRFFIMNKKGKVVKSLRSDIDVDIFRREFKAVMEQ